MTQDGFVKALRGYVNQILAGVCKDPDALQFAVDVNGRGVFLMAKVGSGDFAAIKYGGTLEAMKQLAAQFGSVRVNDNDAGKPFSVFVQLYNPAFDTAFTAER